MKHYESIEDVFTVFKNQHLLEKRKGFYQHVNVVVEWLFKSC